MQYIAEDAVVRKDTAWWRLVCSVGTHNLSGRTTAWRADDNVFITAAFVVSRQLSQPAQPSIPTAEWL